MVGRVSPPLVLPVLVVVHLLYTTLPLYSHHMTRRAHITKYDTGSGGVLTNTGSLTLLITSHDCRLQSQLQGNEGIRSHHFITFPWSVRKLLAEI